MAEGAPATRRIETGSWAEFTAAVAAARSEGLEVRILSQRGDVFVAEVEEAEG